MHIAVLGNEGSWYVEQLSLAAHRRGHTCSRVDFQCLASEITSTNYGVTTEGRSLTDFDAVIVRTMPPGSLEQVVYRMDVLQQLQRLGKSVLNSPRAIECAVDKFLTTARLAEAKLPVPKTVVCENSEQALVAFESLGGDVVVKPLFGAEGRGILRVSDPDLAFRAFRTLERLDNVLYVQKFIAHPGHDVRVMVLDGEVLGGIKRSNPNDFRTNVSRHGTATIHDVTEEETRLALESAKAVEATFAGVDLLYDLSGNCYVIEVNAVPGWRAFAKATQIDVASKVIVYLENQQNVRVSDGSD